MTNPIKMLDVLSKVSELSDELKFISASVDFEQNEITVDTDDCRIKISVNEKRGKNGDNEQDHNYTTG